MAQKLFKVSVRMPWYADGLRFECQRCGQCCGGAPGVVWVTPDEGEAIASYLGITVKNFYETYTRRVAKRISLTEKPNGDCVMMGPDGCTIYAVRPVQCRTFPFWPWNLKSPADWDALAKECPGVNKGKLYSYEEIEELRLQRL